MSNDPFTDSNNIKKQLYENIDHYIECSNQPSEKREELKKQIIIKMDKTKCFKCLDTGKEWWYRGEEFKKDGKGLYYVCLCSTCNEKNKGKFLEDSKNDIIYDKFFYIKIFNRINNDPNDRFLEILNTIDNKEKKFVKALRKSIEYKIKKSNFHLKIDSLLNDCTKLLNPFIGNLSVLLSSVEMDIRSCILQENNQLFSGEKIDENEKKTYVFYKITHTTKEKELFCSNYFHFSSKNTCLKIYFYIFVPKNKMAENFCEEILNGISNNITFQLSSIDDFLQFIQK